MVKLRSAARLGLQCGLLVASDVLGYWLYCLKPRESSNLVEPGFVAIAGTCSQGPLYMQMLEVEGHLLKDARLKRSLLVAGMQRLKISSHRRIAP